MSILLYGVLTTVTSMKHEVQQAMATLASMGIVATPLAAGAVYYYGPNVYTLEVAAAGIAVFIILVLLPALYIALSSLREAGNVEVQEGH